MEYVWKEVNATRDVSGNAFPQGVIDYNFGVSSAIGWIPAKSYFKVDMKVTADGKQPNELSETAFAEHAVGALFNNCYALGGGQDISSCVNGLPQASMVKNRISKSGAWLNSVGKSAYGLEPNFQKRINEVATSSFDTADQLVINLTDDPANPTTCAIDNTGVVTGVNTKFTRLSAGDKLVVNGITYDLQTVTNDTAAQIVAGGTLTAVTANTNCHGLKVTDGSGRNTVSMMYQPPIGLMELQEPLPGGDYRLSLNPNSDYKTACVQSTRTEQKASIEIQNVKLYVCTVKQQITQNPTLSLTECAIYSKPINKNANGLDFTVPNSTFAISVWLQDSTSGTNVVVPPTSFTTVNGYERELKSIQLQYANVVKPSTRWNSDYNSTTNQLQQRYLDTYNESGGIFNDGGTESLADWLQRGPLFHFSFIKDKNERSTQLQLSVDYANAFDKNHNIFVAAWHTSEVEIAVENGMIQNVNRLLV
jgi:hypothetical protein